MGPGIVPLKPQTSISRCGSISRLTGIAMRWNSLAPSRKVQDSLARSGVTTGTGGSPGFRRPGTSLPRSVGLPTEPPEPGRSRGYSLAGAGAWVGSAPIDFRSAPVAIKPAATTGPVPRKSRRVLGWFMIGSLCDVENSGVRGPETRAPRAFEPQIPQFYLTTSRANDRPNIEENSRTHGPSAFRPI